ncbi:hypothetical protein QYF61_024339 [Mycteria americana]|uniref:Uncharacterized protein n=1 Tax=Mycteria americana TaxID=33587 RepID=A0AAN7MJK3_MYCAM|nr:hypothetical protein QYF61_024339 [Mycteria americana]
MDYIATGILLSCSCVKKAFRTMINHAWIAQKQEGGIVEEWLSEKGHDLIDVSNPAFDGAWEPEIKVSRQFRNIIQRSAPRPDSYEWQGVWHSMGKCLGRWAPPVFWNFTPEQVQDPEKLVEYLEKVCRHPANSRETQITVMCWGLAHAYRALFNTIQNPQGEEQASGSGDKTADTIATPAPTATATVVTPALSSKGTVATPAPLQQPLWSLQPSLRQAPWLLQPRCDRHRGCSSPPATGTAAIPAPSATGTAANPALETDNAVEPGNQPVLVSVAPIHKKKSWKRKSARLEREDERAGPSRGEEEEELEDEMETTQSLSLSELRDMRKDFSHRPGKHIVTWLLRCWDNRITESRYRIGWKRPLRSSSPTVNLTLPRPPLYYVHKHLIQTSFKYLQGWRLNHLTGPVAWN